MLEKMETPRQLITLIVAVRQRFNCSHFTAIRMLKRWAELPSRDGNRAMRRDGVHVGRQTWHHLKMFLPA